MNRHRSSYYAKLPLIWLSVICAGIAACEKEENISGAQQVSMMMVPITDTLPSFIAENTLLTNTHPWYITDWVYVGNEATLTIEPGTVIEIAGQKGTGAGLVITRGAKIMAEGLANWPVLFQLNDTSGAWSGIVLLGRAPQKKRFSPMANIAAPHSSGWAYGGDQPDDSSGVLQHVRITAGTYKGPVKNKFPGDGLLLLGVGDKTVIQDVTTVTPANTRYSMEAKHPE